MSRNQRQAMIDRDHDQLSLVRQCNLLDVSRASVYYQPVATRAEDLEFDGPDGPAVSFGRLRRGSETPFYGSRKMRVWLRGQGHQVNRKRIRRLMRLMGLEAIYRRPNTSKPGPDHQVYPYLLKGLEINRVNQVWASDRKSVV